MLVGDIGAGQPANETDGGDRFAGVIEGAWRLLVDWPGIPAEADRAVDHTDTADFGERARHHRERERPERLDLDQTDWFALVARDINRVLGGAGHAADGHQRIVGVVESIFLDQRRVIVVDALAPGGVHSRMMRSELCMPRHWPLR